jgi:hypothetical protein
MAEESKPRKDYAIHTNQVDIMGRVAKPASNKGDDKFVRVSLVVPVWGRDARQWVPFPIDVVGDKREIALKATAGDFFRCTCFIVKREVQDDNGDKKTMLMLQLDPYREVGLMPADADKTPFLLPHDYGLCYSRVLLAGRHFINKKQLAEGKDTPILRDGKGGKYCFVKMKYEDPFQQVPEGEWPDSVFMDFALNGAVAEMVSEKCKRHAQLVIRGEITRDECDFQVKGKTPKQIKIRVMPGGFQFVNFGGGGETRTPASPEKYDVTDTEGIHDDDDLSSF